MERFRFNNSCLSILLFTIIGAFSQAVIFNEFLTSTFKLPASDENYTDETTLCMTTPNIKGTILAEVKDLFVTNISSSSFYLKWTSTGLLQENFTVTIKRIQPKHTNHYWNNLCAKDMNESEISYIINVTTLFVNQLLPDFIYTAFVKLEHQESGLEKNVTTLTAASDKPENVVSSVIVKTYNKSNIMEITLYWEMPCNTNGPADIFFIDVSFIYFKDTRSSNLTYKKYIGSENDNFNFTIKDVSSASNYLISIYASGSTNQLNGTKFITAFLTDDNYPSQPEDIQIETSSNNLSLSWREPDNKPGKIISYSVKLQLLKINWAKMPECWLNTSYFIIIKEVTETKLCIDNILSGASYNIEIAAQTSIGWGNTSSKQINSSMSEPEAVQNIGLTSINESAVLLYFTPRCFFGSFQFYDIQLKEIHYESTIVDPITIRSWNKTSLTLPNILPEIEYEVNVTVGNSEFNHTSTTRLITPSIIPSFNMTKIEENASPRNITSNQVVLTLAKETFTSDQNPILYMAIIISDKNETGGEMNKWNKSIWPSVILQTKSKIYYQATSQFYNPFADKDTVYFVLGVNDTCTENQDNCNAPLIPATKYYIFFRIFNAEYYRNTMPISFVTKESSLPIILGILFGLLFILILIIGFVFWRKGIINKVINKVRPLPSIEMTEISQAEFIRYCCYLEQYPDVLATQWQELQTKSLEIYEAHQTAFAVLPENKRKNRYTDILPFDLTRVKLNIDEDDEMCSDYINASHIKGFSNNEYIATQGPLSHTVRDFWKMVIQENVSIIVMVARFYENKMEKCSKYFPNNHEIILFGDDIEVRCTTELNLNTYCVRTLEVRKGLKQQTVIHMQFVEWPDFGVPKGTDDLIYFCNQFRERWDAEGGRALVHCSAGVGRTGTIIATDILINSIKAGRKIDVFNTVLELRKQRKSMVQRQTQYLYIYQMIRCFLEEGGSYSLDTQEHIYENIQLAQDFRNKEEQSL